MCIYVSLVMPGPGIYGPALESIYSTLSTCRVNAIRTSCARMRDAPRRCSLYIYIYARLMSNVGWICVRMGITYNSLWPRVDLWFPVVWECVHDNDPRGSKQFIAQESWVIGNGEMMTHFAKL